jgi:hypothetical protein
MFVPPDPLPLAQFVEDFPLTDADLEFKPFEISRSAVLTLSEVKKTFNNIQIILSKSLKKT